MVLGQLRKQMRFFLMISLYKIRLSPDGTEYQKSRI